VSVVHPLILIVAVAAAALVGWAIVAAFSRERRDAFTYSNLTFLLDAARVSPWPARILCGAVVAGVLLAGTAFAGVRVIMPVAWREGSVVVCLDTSGSMRATDVDPSREAAVRDAARRFVAAVPAGTRIAIVSFATTAQQVGELTDDRDTILQAIDNVPPANGATAIGDALALAGRILPATGKRAVVLVTDGVNNRGSDPLTVAQELASRRIPVYTVGIGTNGSGLAIPGTSEEASIDEDALRAIAASGGGTYTRTSDAPALAAAFGKLARQVTWERRRVDISFGLAVAGAATLLATFLGAVLAGRFP